jgi:hypothetical protein
MPSDQAIVLLRRPRRRRDPRGNRKAGVRAGQTRAIRAEVTKAAALVAPEGDVASRNARFVDGGE